MGLPRRYAVAPTKRGRILKHAFSQEPPREIQRREKQGFEVLIDEWLRDEPTNEFITTIQNTESDLLHINIT